MCRAHFEQKDAKETKTSVRFQLERCFAAAGSDGIRNRGDVC